MRLLRRKKDKAPVIAALVPEGAPVLASDEIELVPGPALPALIADVVLPSGATPRWRRHL
jgi:hypothetical protein